MVVINELLELGLIHLVPLSPDLNSVMLLQRKIAISKNDTTLFVGLEI
jgi:hypothetical protein